jgi:Asp-tRNA(Asn)/Glu-tRNA(Gln) amidotransferase A subunit family amidase
VTEPQDLSLRQQADAIAAGNLDPSELLDATLARIAARDGDLNSTPIVFPDEAKAMLAASARGPLRGVPVTVKDMYALPWRGARNGTSVELIPPSASGGFRRLQEAGAIVVGVANQHELGMGTTGVLSGYGRHMNPWNLRRSPGGSSGGSAAAVSARLVAGSLGSDSGGSTRLPAAYCGVVGLKVTYRAIPYDGYFGRGTTFSAPGVFCRDAGDARFFAAAMLQRPLPRTDVSRLRVGIVTSPMWDDCDPATRAAVDATVDACGWERVELDVPSLPLATATTMVRLSSEVGTPAPDVVDAISPVTRAVLLASLLRPVNAVAAADRVRAALRREVAAAFEMCDVIAWPASPAPAPLQDAPFVALPSGTTPVDVANVRQSGLANLCGVPGISIPAGFVEGMPVGLQLLAPWGDEGCLLDAAEHVEEETGRRFVDQVPPIALVQ